MLTTVLCYDFHFFGTIKKILLKLRNFAFNPKCLHMTELFSTDVLPGVCDKSQIWSLANIKYANIRYDLGQKSNMQISDMIFGKYQICKYQIWSLAACSGNQDQNNFKFVAPFIYAMQWALPRALQFAFKIKTSEKMSTSYILCLKNAFYF